MKLLYIQIFMKIKKIIAIIKLKLKKEKILKKELKKFKIKK